MLAATCLMVLLLDPWAILDLGGWLSAAALWGASRFSRWTDRALGKGFGWRTLGSSLGATLATAPITAAALGTVALAGLALNFVAIPLAAIAVPGVLASLLLYPILPASARAFAAGAGFTLHLLELSAIAGAAIPAGHLQSEPGHALAAVPWVAVLAAGHVGHGVSATRSPKRGGGWGGSSRCAVWVTLARGASEIGCQRPRPRVTFSRRRAGRWRRSSELRRDIGWWSTPGRPATGPTRAAASSLRSCPATAPADLALVVVSHAHADHLGGVPARPVPVSTRAS